MAEREADEPAPRLRGNEGEPQPIELLARPATERARLLGGRLNAIGIGVHVTQLVQQVTGTVALVVREGHVIESHGLESSVRGHLYEYWS